MKEKTPNIARSKVTSYIASLHSRQEYKPLLGVYIENAKAEPLHMKNNVIKEQFMKLFKIWSGAKKYSDIPQNSLFFDFVNFVHDKMGYNFLSKKIERLNGSTKMLGE